MLYNLWYNCTMESIAEMKYDYVNLYWYGKIFHIVI
jgi:hypothetical protein